MNNKKNCIVLLIVLLVFNLIGHIYGNKKHNKENNDFIGDYECYYPVGTRNIFYVNYYFDNGTLYGKQIGLREYKPEKFVQEGNHPLSFKSLKDGWIHMFKKNRSGEVDKLIIKTPQNVIINGIKLPLKINKNNKLKAEEKYSIKALVDDFDQMIRIMRYLHPAIYVYTSKEEFVKFINNSRAKITKPLKMNEFFKIAAPVIAKLGCVHSSLRPSVEYRLSKNSKYFPMKVHLIKDKLYIIESFIKNLSHLRGTEIISINGETIDLIKKKMFRFLSSDWHNIQYKEFAMSAGFYIYYYYLYGSVDKFQIKYKLKNKLKSIEVDGLFRENINNVSKNFPKHPIYKSNPYSFTLMKNGKIALLSIKHFEFYQADLAEKFYEFIDRSFLEIKNKNIKNLMIDIRGNGGGYPGASQYLLSYLIQKPFQYFTKFHKAGGEAYHRLFKLQKPKKNLFKGNLITLIDNGNLSTSGHFVSLLKYHRVGKLVGIITGSNYSCTHGESRYKLRNTGMLLRMSKERFTSSVKGQKRDEGIYPDIKIDITLEDLLDERDIQLEKALALF